MRSLTLLILLAAVAAKGQQPWEFTQGELGRDILIEDIHVDSTGATLSARIAHTLVEAPFEGELWRISIDGELISERKLSDTSYSMTPAVMLFGADHRLHVMGTYSNLDETIWGFFHFGATTDGVVQDSAFYESPEFVQTGLANAVQIPSGELILAGSGRANSEPSHYSKIIKIQQDGTFSNVQEFNLSPFLQVTWDIVNDGDGVLLSIEGWSPRSVYVKLSSALENQDQWEGQAPYPDPLNPADSILTGAMTIRALGHGQYIVGGRINTPDSHLRSTIYRMDSTGDVTASFVPPSTFMHDYSAALSTISSIDDNTFYFLSWKNFSAFGHFPYQPQEPDVLHVYKMDNDLNVLCEYELDGFATNMYYVPNRIKTTPDGGFVIIGGRKDMSDPNSNFVGWARKFNPTDCVVGVEESSGANNATIFPNPGTDGFSVLLSGPVLNRGSVQLYDATGAMVATTSMEQSAAKVDGRQLTVGLYLYRVVDQAGNLRASGRWVKQ